MNFNQDQLKHDVVDPSTVLENDCSKLVSQWFQLQEKIVDYQTIIKDWKAEQKELSPSITAWMKKNKIQSVSTKSGTIELSISERLKPQKEKKN